MLTPMQLWRLTISDKLSFHMQFCTLTNLSQNHWAVVPSILKRISVPRGTPEIDNALYVTPQQSQEGYHLMEDLAEQVPCQPWQNHILPKECSSGVPGSMASFILVRSCQIEMRIRTSGLLSVPRKKQSKWSWSTLVHVMEVDQSGGIAGEVSWFSQELVFKIAIVWCMII